MARFFDTILRILWWMSESLAYEARSNPGLTLAVVAITSAFCLWKLPQWQTRRLGLEPKDRFDRVNEARKTLAQIFGGVALLVGVYSASQNFNLARQSLVVAQQGQITDRFTKAIDQLGSVDGSGRKRLELRLGGIYALQRIADESERDRWSIVAILSAYVRENSRWRSRDDSPPTSRSSRLPEDIQAVVTVLGRREPTCELNKLIDLNHTNLQGASLLGAKFLCGDLSDSNLTHVDLSVADLRGALLYRSDLSDANLSKANLYGEVDEDEIRMFHWPGAGGMDFYDMVVEEFAVNPSLRVATAIGLRRDGLREANLRNADLTQANLTREKLEGADVTGANLKEALLYHTDLTQVIGLTQLQIDSANGDAATLLPANLRRPDKWRSTSIRLVLPDPPKAAGTPAGTGQ